MEFSIIYTLLTLWQYSCLELYVMHNKFGKLYILDLECDTRTKGKQELFPIIQQLRVYGKMEKSVFTYFAVMSTCFL